MFLLPDNVMEKLRCDFCQKYLSVGPVTVDENRKMRCGRCSKPSASQVSSMYRLFGESAVFKCINRFEGCNTLLRYTEVLEHEKVCMSKISYKCPLCNIVDTKKYTPFELIQHFKNLHETFYLNQPFLKTTIHKILPKNVYLYHKENLIFFIFLDYQSCNQALLLNTYLIGNTPKEGVNMHQKYNVSIENKKFQESKIRKCLPFQMFQEKNNGPTDVFELTNSDINNSLIIIHFMYEESLMNHDLFKEEKNLHLKQFQSSSTSRCIAIANKEQVMDQFGNKNISLSQCKTKLVQAINFSKFIEINLNCLICSALTENNLYINSEGNKRHLICNKCIKICKKRYQYFEEFLGNTSNERLSIMNYLKFSCIWNCKAYNTISEIYSHERDCPNSVPTECPFESCNFSGTFPFLQQHFQDGHQKTLSSVYSITVKEGFITNDYVWLEHLGVIVYISVHHPFNFAKNSYCGYYSISTRIANRKYKRNVHGIVIGQERFLEFKNECQWPIGSAQIYFTSVTK